MKSISALSSPEAQSWLPAAQGWPRPPRRSDLRVGKFTAPALAVHGEDDAVVPVTLGDRLYGLIRAPKRFVRIPRAGHLASSSQLLRP
jgi:pimeloyl-ACP methyl ester carboxylesterase